MNKLKKHVYISKVLDPYENLAMEEYLLSTCSKNEVILFLWQNEKTIVIGKHQNPLKECNLPLMEKDHIKLVRRKSGGGAVFHDIGNLNFTFIGHKHIYDENKHFEVIIEALKDWGIVGTHTGRNDLEINHQKFSGNAFIHHKEVSCHHGTLLVNVAMEDLGKYLTPSKIKIESKGIDSVKSRVVNLSQLNSQLNIADLKDSLVNKFDDLYEGELEILPLPDHEDIQISAQKYKKWKWNIGESPNATVSKSKKMTWGNIDLELSIKNGRILHCLINTDALCDEEFTELANSFIGKEIQKSVIKENIIKIIKDKVVAFDLVELFNDYIV